LPGELEAGLQAQRIWGLEYHQSSGLQYSSAYQVVVVVEVV